MHPVAELVVRLAVAAVVALAVGLLDGPLFAMDFPWWVCVAIGLVLVFGGVLIISHADDW